MPGHIRYTGPGARFRGVLLVSAKQQDVRGRDQGFCHENLHMRKIEKRTARDSELNYLLKKQCEPHIKLFLVLTIVVH